MGKGRDVWLSIVCGVLLLGSTMVYAAVCTVNNGLIAAPNPNIQLNGVAGNGGTVIGVGQNNAAGQAAVVYVNGVAIALPAGTPAQLNAVAMASPTYAVLVGENGGLVQLQNVAGTWTATSLATPLATNDLYAAVTLGANQTYVAGKQGIFFFNGTKWTQQSIIQDIMGMWSNGTTMFAVSKTGQVLQKSVVTPPTAWTTLVTLNNPVGAQYSAITGDGAGNLYLTGQSGNGGFISKISAATGAMQAGFPVLTIAQMNGIAVNSATGTITAVGDANLANNANAGIATVNPNGTGLTQPAPAANSQQINGVYIAPNGTTYMAGVTATGCTANPPATSGLDHIRITHTGTALTCSPQTVTLDACADAACTTLYTAGGVNVTLSPGGQTFTIGTTGTNAAATVSQTTAGTATLATTTVTPATAAATTCVNGASTSCAMTFNTAGFLVTAPNHAACTNAAVTIEAMQAGTANRCVPAYSNVTQPVNLSLTYSNPATGTKSATVATGTISSTASAHSLAFDATGKATLALSYPDVGQVTLNASGTAPNGAAMSGSGMFIAAPASFGLSNITAAPIKAGSNFNATVTAMTGIGNACTTAVAAPNFAKETPAQSVVLSHTLATPVGGNAGTLSSALGAYTNGASVAALSWSEVGNINLNAALAGGAYLGYVTAPTGTAAAGRFIPEHLDTMVTSGCVSCGFSYTGQPFTTTVIARNAQGGTTSNYDGALGFAKAVTLSDANANTNGVLSGNAVAASAFAAGVANATGLAYQFTVSPGLPTVLKMRALDADAVSTVRTPPALSVEGTSEIRSGRIRLSNSHGSNLLPLNLTATVQMFTANGWVTSILDRSTVLALAPTYTVGAGTTAASFQPVAIMASCGAAVPAGTAYCGLWDIVLSKPSNGGGAAFISPTAPSYLPLTAGRATFGVYKGSNKVIDMRESF